MAQSRVTCVVWLPFILIQAIESLTQNGINPNLISSLMHSSSAGPRNDKFSSDSMNRIRTRPMHTKPQFEIDEKQKIEFNLAAYAIVLPMSAAFSTLECAWSEQYATRRAFISESCSPGVRSWKRRIACVRPANKHTSVASDAVVCSTPPPLLLPPMCKKSSGNPIILPSQFMTIVSSSVQAGDDA